MFQRIWQFSLVGILFLAPSVAVADYISPGTVSIKTKHYRPQSTEFEKGTYFYDVSWQGIKVGKAEVQVKDRTLDAQEFLQVTASARTARFIEIFYKLRHTSESLFDADSLKPRRFYTAQTEKSREKIREVSFGDDGRIRSVTTKNGKRREPVEFVSENLTLDPISAAFIARTLPIDPGKEFEFDVFNGKHRYLISFSVEGREIISLNGKDYDAFKVVPSVQKLTDTEGEKRLKSATIWVSADQSREVLKMKSKVLVGSVSARLTGFAPETHSDPVRSEQLHARLPQSHSDGDRARMLVR